MHVLLCEPDIAFREEIYKAMRKRNWKVTSLPLPQFETGQFDAVVVNSDILPESSREFTMRVLILTKSSSENFTGETVVKTGDPVKVAREIVTILAKPAK
jgi:hypothetical protein